MIFVIIKITMYQTKKKLREKIADRLKSEWPINPNDIELAPTPDEKLGDLALSLAFPLAKKLKTNPRTIASRAVELLTGLEGVERIEIAGAGYINLYLDRQSFFEQKFKNLNKSGLEPEEKKSLLSIPILILTKQPMLAICVMLVWAIRWPDVFVIKVNRLRSRTTLMIPVFRSLMWSLA